LVCELTKHLFLQVTNQTMLPTNNHESMYFYNMFRSLIVSVCYSTLLHIDVLYGIKQP
jgi:hypothetical protein